MAVCTWMWSEGSGAFQPPLVIGNKDLLITPPSKLQEGAGDIRWHHRRQAYGTVQIYAGCMGMVMAAHSQAVSAQVSEKLHGHGSRLRCRLVPPR